MGSKGEKEGVELWLLHVKEDKGRPGVTAAPVAPSTQETDPAESPAQVKPAVHQESWDKKGGRDQGRLEGIGAQPTEGPSGGCFWDALSQRPAYLSLL